jgi:hypothetical protein
MLPAFHLHDGFQLRDVEVEVEAEVEVEVEVEVPSSSAHAVSTTHCSEGSGVTNGCNSSDFDAT